MHTEVHMHTCWYIHMHVHTHRYTHVSIHAHALAYTSAHMQVCTHACTYTHIRNMQPYLSFSVSDGDQAWLRVLYSKYIYPLSLSPAWSSSSHVCTPLHTSFVCAHPFTLPLYVHTPHLLCFPSPAVWTCNSFLKTLLVSGVTLLAGESSISGTESSHLAGSGLPLRKHEHSGHLLRSGLLSGVPWNFRVRTQRHDLPRSNPPWPSCLLHSPSLK